MTRRQKHTLSASISQLRKKLGGISRESIIRFMDQVLCDICGIAATGRRHAIDHSHSTKKIRGVLCHNCNLGIGHFKDDPDLMRQAADYLEVEHYAHS